MENKAINYEIQYSKIKNIYIHIKDGKVIVKAPKRVSKKQIEEIVNQKKEWIIKSLEKESKRKEKEPLYTLEEFKEIIEKNINELVKTTGLQPNKVRIRDIKYAWGSCSKDRNITLNYKLISYSEDAIRYVIIHELCHIKHMNHSKEFWGLLEKYMPNYKEVKKEFK